MACERLRKGLVCQYIYIVASSLGLMLFFLPRLPACMHVCHFPSCLTCQAALVILRRAASARLKVVGRSNSGPILRLAQASRDGHSSMHGMTCVSVGPIPFVSSSYHNLSIDALWNLNQTRHLQLLFSPDFHQQPIIKHRSSSGASPPYRSHNCLA